MADAAPILDVRDLRIEYPLAEGGVFVAVESASLTIGAGEIHALVGESGPARRRSATQSWTSSRSRAVWPPARS